ncbi:hypothetical protein JZ751_029267 [Albula glossodonta]|uniref:Sodium/potassium-transporting ATPase subunit beta n=1 Tax=Albula glossodonta TaxID=121402 RepID=A0A8T2PAG0_9TELE|nr:hypothetical protein JZ751_029267 [Albula glossodonta]
MPDQLDLEPRAKIKILIFYVIFYGCLAGIFVGTIQALLLTLSDHKPTYQDRVAPPAPAPSALRGEAEHVTPQIHPPPMTLEVDTLSIRPVRATTGAQHDQRGHCGNETNEFSWLTPIIRSEAGQLCHAKCGPPAIAGNGKTGGYTNRGDLDSDVGTRKACMFKRSWLGECSGLNDTTFGFKYGKPCLIVKLNRIVNFRPKPPTSNDSIPEAAQSKVQPDVIPIHCSNKREEDQGKIGEILYFGLAEGFPLQYYPYYGKLLHRQYLQPLVAVKFTNLTLNQELRIECRVFGQNIQYSEKDRYQGRFDIKIHVKDS